MGFGAWLVELGCRVLLGMHKWQLGLAQEGAAALSSRIAAQCEP